MRLCVSVKRSAKSAVPIVGNVCNTILHQKLCIIVLAMTPTRPCADITMQPAVKHYMDRYQVVIWKLTFYRVGILSQETPQLF